MLRPILLTSCFVSLVVLPRVAFGWGDEVHRMVARSATLALPEEVRPFFTTCRHFLAKHSLDPDLAAAGDPSRKSKHWLDIDHYGEYPFDELPRSFDDAVEKFGRDTVETQGTLPWEIERLYRELVSAFQAKRWSDVRLKASILSHYVADAHVPFHATTNYNGQLTGNLGIHGRFEIEMANRYVVSRYVVPGPAVEVSDVCGFAFDIIIESNRLVPVILNADDAARKVAPIDGERYYLKLYRSAGQLAERRVREAATATASLWYSAWLKAGRPKLPPRRAVVLLLDRDDFDSPALVPSGWEAALALARKLERYDAIALRLANAPKHRWERGVTFRHAVDVEGDFPGDGGPAATFSPDMNLALREGLSALEEFEHAEKIMVILTDGLLPKLKVAEVKGAARRLGVKLWCIGFGPRKEMRELVRFVEDLNGRADIASNLDAAVTLLRKNAGEFLAETGSRNRQPVEVAP